MIFKGIGKLASSILKPIHEDASGPRRVPYSASATPSPSSYVTKPTTPPVRIQRTPVMPANFARH